MNQMANQTEYEDIRAKVGSGEININRAIAALPPKAAAIFEELQYATEHNAKIGCGEFGINQKPGFKRTGWIKTDFTQGQDLTEMQKMVYEIMPKKWSLIVEISRKIDGRLSREQIRNVVDILCHRGLIERRKGGPKMDSVQWRLK